MSTKPEHIVVATDFSPAADVAVRRAAALAQGHDSPLHVVHVREPKRAGPGAAEPSERLTELAQQLHDRAGIAVEPAAVDGNLESTLAEVADHAQADLVVIGRDHAPFLRRILRGKTSMRCLRALDQPLLITRDADVPAYSRLLLPVDFNAAGRQALRLARQWFADAELHVLHVMVPELEAAPMEMPWSATAAAALEPQLSEIESQRLAEWLRESDCDLPPARRHIAFGPVPRATAEVAERIDAQLIIAASDCDGRLGSIVAGLAAEGGRDILLLNTSRLRAPA